MVTGDRVGGEIETKRLGGCVMMSFTIRTRPNGGEKLEGPTQISRTTSCPKLALSTFNNFRSHNFSSLCSHLSSPHLLVVIFCSSDVLDTKYDQ